MGQGKYGPLAFFLLLLTTCGFGRSESLSNLKVTPSNVREGTVAYLSESCPVSEPAKEAILAPLVALGISFASDLISNTISQKVEERKENLNGTFIAGTSSEGFYKHSEGFYKQNDSGKIMLRHRCIIIARGLIGDVYTNKGISKRNKIASSEMDSEHLKALGLADFPAFYFEASLEEEGSGSVTLQPKYVFYAASSAKNPGSGKKNIGIVIALTKSSPKREEIESVDALALFRIYLGRLEIGRSYEHKGDQGILIGTKVMQELPDKTDEEGNPLLHPFNLTAVVSETEDPSLLLKVLSSTLKSHKDDLSKALSEVLKDAIGGAE